MKTLLITLSILLSFISFSQNDSTLQKQYKHTFFLGNPTNFEGGGINLSAHYTLGFKNKNNKNREVQLGYRINTHTPTGGFLDFHFTANSQVFSVLWGDRKYLTDYTVIFKPYFNWQVGLDVINFEDGAEDFLGFGNTVPLPNITIGLYTEINNRFDVGFTLGGLLPTGSFRLGYRFL